MPCRTSRRFPPSPSSSRRSGSHGARPRTPSTLGASALRTATAPPIEKPRRSVRGAPAAATGGACVLFAELKRVPGLDAVAHLQESDGREEGRDAANEPLERRAPRAGQPRRLAAIHTDDRRSGSQAGHAHLGAGRERDRWNRRVIGAHVAHGLVAFSCTAASQLTWRRRVRRKRRSGSELRMVRACPSRPVQLWLSEVAAVGRAWSERHRHTGNHPVHGVSRFMPRVFSSG